jgi:hypothetical protein
MAFAPRWPRVYQAGPASNPTYSGSGNSSEMSLRFFE